MAAKRKKNAWKIGKILLAVIVVSYFGFTFLNQHFQMKDLNEEIAGLNQQIQEQEELKQELAQKLEEQDELEQIEEAARNELGFLKGDETVFVDSSAK